MPLEPERCHRCNCPTYMHFFDGCHTSFGFICRCPLTRLQLETEPACSCPTDAEIRAAIHHSHQQLTRSHDA